MQPTSSNLPDLLATRLTLPLPGRTAQSQFEPELAYGRYYDPPDRHARSAAVIALLYRVEGVWHIPLTVRPAHMLAHAGQISLPGGMVEPDESNWSCAVRELSEELGSATDNVKALGSLSPVNLFVTNFLITPWLAWTDERPRFTPNAAEVEEVLEVPLHDLCNPATHGQHLIQRGRLSFETPHFVWQQHRIWGATALILGELIALLEQV